MKWMAKADEGGRGKVQSCYRLLKSEQLPGSGSCTFLAKTMLGSSLLPGIEHLYGEDFWAIALFCTVGAGKCMASWTQYRARPRALQASAEASADSKSTVRQTA